MFFELFFSVNLLPLATSTTGINTDKHKNKKVISRAYELLRILGITDQSLSLVEIVFEYRFIDCEDLKPGTGSHSTVLTRQKFITKRADFHRKKRPAL